jgi:ferredoxin
MATELGLAVRRRSATPTSSTDIRRDAVEVSKLVDIDLCIGCKACEIACKEWNDLEAEETSNFGGYQSHEDLTPNTWDLMRFNEVDLGDDGIAWLIRKDSCLHCEEPGCLLACPAPGAIVQYENGIVDFDQDKCIGCQYCHEKVTKLQDRGFDDALLYDPEGVSGVHMMYVVPRGQMLEDYGLPNDPTVKSGLTFFPVMSALRKLGSAAMWAGLIGSALFFLRTGRRFPPPEEEAVASAHARGPAPGREGGDTATPAESPREGGDG